MEGAFLMHGYSTCYSSCFFDVKSLQSYTDVLQLWQNVCYDIILKVYCVARYLEDFSV